MLYVMGFSARRRRWRAAATVLTVAALGSPTLFGVTAAEASGILGANPGGANAAVKLPALPAVPLAITDGIGAEKLLSDAVTLSSVGVDTTALQAAISQTQAKLDVEAVTAQQARTAAVAADREAAQAGQAAAAAEQQYQSLQGAVKAAVLSLYTDGPALVTLNPAAGDKLAYAADYADTTLTPTGVLATRRSEASAHQGALVAARRAQKTADKASAAAAVAVAAQRTEQARLDRLLASISTATAVEVASDHAALAAQAGQELLSSSALQFDPKDPLPAPVSTTAVALTWAFSELGKTYVWGGTGPNTFDCSGLTQYVWRAAGVQIPRVAAAQYSWTVPVPLSQLLPGDLVFYGRTDIHHVGIYIGDGLMINAPHTGDVVRVSSIWWSDLAGFGRVHAVGTPVPAHMPPSATAPAVPVVVPKAGPVPSQTKPPKGWKPTPGSSTPFQVYAGNPSTPASTTTTAPPPAPSTTTTTLGTTTLTLPPDTTSTAPAETTTTSPADTTTTTVVDPQSTSTTVDSTS